MKKLFVITVILFAITSCKTSTTTGTYYNYNTSCIGVENDGSQTLLAWGEGRNKTDAVEQAKKNAVSDVIFKGINDGNNACSRVPLLNVPNARQRYEEYFNIFFADGGEYRKYISMADEKSGSRNNQKYQYGRKVNVTVRVLRSELKKRLQDDGLLK